MVTLTDIQINLIGNKAQLLEKIDKADLAGAYNQANMLSKIYDARYIECDMGLARWLELRYRERYGGI